MTPKYYFCAYCVAYNTTANVFNLLIIEEQ